MFKKPQLRSENDDVMARHATWLELFYDLVFVSALAHLGELLFYDYTVIGFSKFVFLFLPIWWAWIGHTMLANRFDTDDVFHRLGTFLQMLCAIFLAVSVDGALGKEANSFALAYSAIRLILILSYFRVYLHLKDLRSNMRPVMLGFVVGTSFWLASIIVPTPFKFYFWGLGLLIDFLATILSNPKLIQMPVHGLHLQERLGLFMIIVLGESVIAVVKGISDIHWTQETLLVAFSGFFLAINIWWFYFEYLENFIRGKALGSGQFYIYGHLPIYLALITLAIGIEHNIIRYKEVDASLIHLGICGSLLLFVLPIICFEFKRSQKIRLIAVRKPVWIFFGSLAFLYYFGDTIGRAGFSILIFVLFLVFSRSKKYIFFN